ncbi:uncharacterized protein LOC110765193 isoform X2 [Prunus avium]|uniref:Uncharacterized protein LOC110765193 isoform X2 n=1 Tax=Prunus avium TaxID=42229 RepID=A0A6P5TA71_PRUAV|nr:uncharacterized protein LOC110765193 isoform X2 [Prunus avium]
MDGLRGPWMIVTPRRKSKHMANDKGNKVPAGKNNGSRFDVLRQVGETPDMGESLANGHKAHTGKTQAGSSRRDADIGQKVWTKSTTNFVGSRTALNDISNAMVEENATRKTNSKNTDGPARMNPGTLVNRGKMIIGGKRIVQQISVQEQLNSWIQGNKEYNDKGTYIFGHQPPNIGASNIEHDEDCDTEFDDAHEGEIQQEHMEMSEGQNEPSLDEKIENNPFIIEGMPLGL